MKKFNADGPEYGLFDLAAPRRELGMAFARTGTPPSMLSTSVWDDAPERPLSLGNRVYRGIGKRVFDIVLILASVPFVLPVVALCALALWIEGGQPFYTQARLGRRGEKFSILKLRTMVRDADKALEEILASDPAKRREWDSLQKLRNDPRVTRVGHFLRATSLDELPQLWNVLKGDMSLIGPRPMMPDQAALYGNTDAYEALRPGITGLWQVSARNGNTFAFRNQVDAAYADKLSFVNDVKIAFRTVGVVLRGTGC